jgi:hypothetical protein
MRCWPDHQNSLRVEVTQPTGSRTFGFFGGSSRSAKTAHGEGETKVTSGQSVPASKNSENQHGWFVTVPPVADGQLAGQIVAAVVTFLGTGGAAYLGARVAGRNTKVVDARAKETAEWQRIDRLVTMACSENPKEAYVGLYLLQQSKADWNSDPEQRAHIRRTLEALNAPAIQAYRGGQTTVVTSPPPSPPPGGP